MCLSRGELLRGAGGRQSLGTTHQLHGTLLMRGRAAQFVVTGDLVGKGEVASHGGLQSVG